MVLGVFMKGTWDERGNRREVQHLLELAAQGCHSVSQDPLVYLLKRHSRSWMNETGLTRMLTDARDPYEMLGSGASAAYLDLLLSHPAVHQEQIIKDILDLEDRPRCLATSDSVTQWQLTCSLTL